jgi:hypothetical protein
VEVTLCPLVIGLGLKVKLQEAWPGEGIDPLPFSP